MYFEDEKDIIDDGSSLHIEEDGSVSWEDILSDTSDGVVEFVDDTTSADVVDQDSYDSNAGIQDVGSGSDVDYSDSSESNSDVTMEVPNQADYSSETYSKEDNIADDFDIDKQLENVSMDHGSSVDGHDFVMPSKKSPKVSSTTILLALVVAIAVMGGVYYYFTNFHNSSEELVPPSTKTQMDNMTQEQLEERANENNKETTSEDTQADDNAPIPVVNDDEVDSLKADEAQKEEKKQVISIIPTGRINPFLPIQKYSQVDVNETIVQYEKSGVQAPPVKMGEKNQDALKMLTISVSGIMYDNVKPSAIITLDNNDYFVQKGDKLDDYKVVDIGKNSVTVALGKNLYKANVGEEFKIQNDFYGRAQYIPQQLGGGRQYYSVVIADSKDKSKKPASKNSNNNKNFDNPQTNGIENVNLEPINENPPQEQYVSEEDVKIITK